MTTADQRLEETKAHLLAAIEALHAVVISKCWGHDDYRADYAATLRAVYLDLVRLQGELEP